MDWIIHFEIPRIRIVPKFDGAHHQIVTIWMERGNSDGTNRKNGRWEFMKLSSCWVTKENIHNIHNIHDTSGRKVENGEHNFIIVRVVIYTISFFLQ